MEKSVSELSFGLVLWQILGLIIQIGIIIILYKVIIWFFKKPKKA
jgi:hypothetical protein